MKGMNVYKPVPEYKEISFTQTNPVAGTTYPVTGMVNQRNVIFDSITAMVTWTVQPDPIDCFVTLDSTGAQTASFNNPVSATWYKVRKDWPELVDYLGFNATTLTQYQGAGMLMGQVVSVSVRTGNVTPGTVQNLNCIIKYWQY